MEINPNTRLDQVEADATDPRVLRADQAQEVNGVEVEDGQQAIQRQEDVGSEEEVRHVL